MTTAEAKVSFTVPGEGFDPGHATDAVLRVAVSEMVGMEVRLSHYVRETPPPTILAGMAHQNIALMPIGSNRWIGWGAFDDKVGDGLIYLRFRVQARQVARATKAKRPRVKANPQTTPLDHRPTIAGETLATFVCEASGMPLVANWFTQSGDQAEIMYLDTITKDDIAARIDAKWIADGPEANTWEVMFGWRKLGRLHELEFLASGEMMINEAEGIKTIRGGVQLFCLGDT